MRATPSVCIGTRRQFKRSWNVTPMQSAETQAWWRRRRRDESRSGATRAARRSRTRPAERNPGRRRCTRRRRMGRLRNHRHIPAPVSGVGRPADARAAGTRPTPRADCVARPNPTAARTINRRVCSVGQRDLERRHAARDPAFQRPRTQQPRARMDCTRNSIQIVGHPADLTTPVERRQKAAMIAADTKS